MSFPLDIRVAGPTISSHFVFETLAYAIGFRLYLARRRRRGDHISDSHRWSVLTAGAIGAVIGSRLLFWLEDPALALSRFQSLAPGKTLVGGLMGSWIAVEMIKRRLSVKEATGDLFAVPLAAGIAIGRIGCFLSGLPDGTYGVATTLPWGIDLGDGVPRHPTALYETLFASVLLALLLWFERRLRRGETFKIFMVAYLSFRLAADSIKPGVRLAMDLTAIQWACVAGLAYYGWWFTRRASGSVRADAVVESAGGPRHVG